MQRSFFFFLLVLVLPLYISAQANNDSTGMSKPSKKSNVELCKATYRASQDTGYVYIFASGEHGTPGYKTYFKKSKLEIFPPKFSFWHIRPTGIVSEHVVTFSDSIKFRCKDPIKSVTVYDATGKHVIEVK
jgi:hypothetical protein